VERFLRLPPETKEEDLRQK